MILIRFTTSRLAPRSNRARAGLGRGFTLVELMVAISIMAVIMLLLGSVVNGVSRAVQQGNSQLQRTGQAQRAFDLVRRTLSEATLRPYFDYVGKNGAAGPDFMPRDGLSGSATAFFPSGYQRQSELRFIAGPASTLTVSSPYSSATVVGHATFFQAPVGRSSLPANAPLRTLLNTVGFYLEYGKRSDLSPTLRGVEPDGKRFRLMMMIEPTESMRVYGVTTDRMATTKDWYTKALAPTEKANLHLLAENIVVFVLRPKEAPLQPADPVNYFSYPYDSSPVGPRSATQAVTEHQLPPIIEVTMVALDNANAGRLEMVTGGNSAAALGLSALFATPADGVYKADLKKVTDYFRDHGITYRTFTTEVALEGAKWSVK